MKISRIFIIGIFLIAIITITGCEYILTQPETGCEPPNKLVTDIYGNKVCVTPENRSIDDIDQSALSDKNESINSSEKMPESEPSDNHQSMEDQKTSSTEEGSMVNNESEVSENIPKKIVKEGDLVSFPNLQAVDPDGDQVSYRFEEPLDVNGEWQTKKGDAGNYRTTIIASDGKNEVRQDILIVVEPVNNAPVISGLQNQITVQEGDKVVLDPVITDDDGQDVKVKYSGWMDSSEYQTTFDDAGEYEVIVSASDGISTTTKKVKIIVQNINRPPVIMKINDIQVEIGELLKIEPKVEDPDNDDITFNYSTPFNDEGIWKPEEGDEGEYNITVIASDGVASDETTFKLVVGTPNKPPVFDKLDNIKVKEGETVKINPSATDPEGKDVKFSYSGWMTSSTYQTNFEDSGEYKVTVTASDGENEVSQEITITVEDVNRPPQINKDWWK